MSAPELRDVSKKFAKVHELSDKVRKVIAGLEGGNVSAGWPEATSEVELVLDEAAEALGLAAEILKTIRVQHSKRFAVVSIEAKVDAEMGVKDDEEKAS